MNEKISILGLNSSTEINLIVEKHEQIMSKNDPADKAIWHSLTIETTQSNSEAIASIKFKNISAFDVKIIAAKLLKLSEQMKKEQPAYLEGNIS